MQDFSFELIGASTKGHAWTQHNGYELAGADRLFHHYAFRLVFIRFHRDTCLRTEAKVPELVAG